MTKITALNHVGSLIDATTAASTINTNFDRISSAVYNTLSRDGSTPNQMDSPLDMNSEQIYNLPVPLTANSPLRLQDLSTFVGGGTVTNIPPGGTSNQVLAKNSNTDFDIHWTSEASGLSAGTNITITGSSPAVVSTVTNPTFVSPSITTPIGIVKTDVGLGNVDNTSDATKNAAVVTLTNKTISGSGNTLSNIANASLTNSTISGVSLGQTLSALSFGTHLISGGSSYNGSSIVTITSDATNANTASTIVARDGSGNFSAGTITASLSGNATSATTATTATTVTTNANLTGAVTSVGNATSLGSFTSASLLAALTDETGTGACVFAGSPTFTGTPLTTTAAVDTNTTQIASTAFVLAQAASATPLIDGTATVGTSTRFARGDHIHPTDTTRAPLASPTFTGTVTFPTPFTLGAISVTSTGTQLNYLNAATGTTGTGSVVFGTSPTIAGGSVTALTSLAVRDTSAAFDLTIAATSSSALTAGRTLTLNMGNVAHTLAFGTTANTITFPNAASDTVAMLAVANTFTGAMTINSASANLTVGGNATPQILFVPSSGATKFAQYYQSGDVWRLATSGVGDKFSVDLNTGQVSVIQNTASTSTATGSLINAGGFGNAGAGFFGGPVVVKNYTVAGLPSAATYQYGIAFVTDSTTTAITGLGLTPVGGGSNIVPVYSDGTNWRII